ncbi:MAG: hypothetical protein K6E90_06950 [Lachnospiraceae bacterium]|nr:hypothetical protein [Lachnospiraceae bacterium]
MGRSGDTGANPEEIQRTRSTEIKTEKLSKEEELFFDNKLLKPQSEEKKSREGAGKDEVKRSNSFAGSSRLNALKMSAEMIPHYVPDKKAAKARSLKPLTKKQQKALEDEKIRREVTGELLSIQKTLEEEETKVFGKKGAGSRRTDS